MVELMELIAKEIKDGCSLEASLDGLPKKGGISAELSPGYNDTVYYNGKAIVTVPVLFLSKGKDQEVCLDNLCRICGYFKELAVYPKAEGFSWLDASAATYPGKVGMQEDGQYIYSAVINMKIYF